MALEGPDALPRTTRAVASCRATASPAARSPTRTLVPEVTKARGKKKPLSVAQAKALKDEHVRTVRPLQALAAEARQLERRLAELVNAGYGLTAEEVALLWRTAPPRMPGQPPGA
jgi:hypothetical protein